MRTIQNTLLPIFIWALFFTPNFASAQDEAVKMGLSLTPNLSWMTSTDYDHLSSGKNLNFGFEFMADIMFSENYAFSTGIHIFQTGGAISYLVEHPDNDYSSSNNFLMTVERDYQLKYVEVPLTFKMRTKEIGYSTIYGRFGLGLGLNIKANASEARYDSWFEVIDGVWTNDVEGPSTPGFSDVEVVNDVKPFRASMIIGGGVERSLGGSSSLLIGVNYNVSFLNTHKDMTQVSVDVDGIPETLEELPVLNALKGHDSAVELVIGLIF